MRLFTGIDIPERERAALDGLLSAMRPLAPLRWSVAANLHVTTKFIGDWPQSRLEELLSVLAGTSVPPPITTSLDGLGWFPNLHQPRIFWVSVKAPKELSGLVTATETQLLPLGIAPEDRPYRPHLTLARIDRPVDLAPVRRAVAALPSTTFGAFQARAFHLYLSESGRYTKLASFALPELNLEEDKE